MESFYKIGSQYIVRTVTMINVGIVKVDHEDYLILEEAAWVGESSRWSDFVKGKRPTEMEPYVNDVIVYKGAIVDATMVSNQMVIELI